MIKNMKITTIHIKYLNQLIENFSFIKDLVFTDNRDKRKNLVSKTIYIQDFFFEFTKEQKSEYKFNTSKFLGNLIYNFLKENKIHEFNSFSELCRTAITFYFNRKDDLICYYFYNDFSIQSLKKNEHKYKKTKNDLDILYNRGKYRKDKQDKTVITIDNKTHKVLKVLE